MLDTEPEFDRKLRALYDHIKTQDPPASLALITTRATRSDRRVLGRLAGAAGIAVLAAGVALFAVELHAHRVTTPPNQHTHTVTPPGPVAVPWPVWSPSPLPSPNPRLALPGLPIRALLPTSVRVLVPETQGTGGASVTIVPQGELFIQYACVGDSSLVVTATDVLGPERRPGCSSSVADATVVGTSLPAYPNQVLKAGDLGKPVTIEISTAPSTAWKIFIAESDPGYGPNLVTNGGFEVPVVSDLTPPIRSLPGWSITGPTGLSNGTPDGYPALDGSQYLVVAGNARGAPGEATQRVDTVPGRTYRLSFLEGAYPNCGGGPYVIDVYWSGTEVLGMSTTVVWPSTASPGTNSEAWYSVVGSSLVATTATTTIRFVGDGECGAAFDDANLQQTPPAP